MSTAYLIQKVMWSQAQCFEVFLGLLFLSHTVSCRREFGCPLCLSTEVTCVTSRYLQPLFPYVTRRRSNVNPFPSSNRTVYGRFLIRLLRVEIVVRFCMLLMLPTSNGQQCHCMCVCPENLQEILQNLTFVRSPCSPVDSITRLMTVWKITGKIIRAAIIVAYAHLEWQVLPVLGFGCFRVLCFVLGFL